MNEIGMMLNDLMGYGFQEFTCSFNTHFRKFESYEFFNP